MTCALRGAAAERRTAPGGVGRAGKHERARGDDVRAAPPRSVAFSAVGLASPFHAEDVRPLFENASDPSSAIPLHGKVGKLDPSVDPPLRDVFHEPPDRALQHPRELRKLHGIHATFA